MQNKFALFIIISSWDVAQNENPIYNWIKSAVTSNLKNIAFCFINQFDWPERSEGLTSHLRHTLLLSSDVSFSQSRYESFGLAQIEPLQYGAVCLISGVSGARYLLPTEILNDAETPIIIADYARVDNHSNRSMLKIFKINWEDIYDAESSRIAKRILEMLTISPDILYEKGRKAVKLFDLNTVANKFMEAIGMKDKNRVYF